MRKGDLTESWPEAHPHQPLHVTVQMAASEKPKTLRPGEKGKQRGYDHYKSHEKQVTHVVFVVLFSINAKGQ